MKNKEKNVKTAVIYSRQSYGEENNSLSIEQQIARCVQWCKRNAVEIKGIFKDSNTSSELYPNSPKGIEACNADKGWNRWLKRERIFKNRKQFRKGLADAFSIIEQQHVDYFIVDEVTRFYRNPWATAQLDIFCIEHLVEHNTALVTVADNKIDELKSSVDIAIRRALQAFESETLMQKAENSKKNRRANINRGIVYSNAYGVEWKNKKINFNPKKAEVIRYVFEAVINGKTYGEILYTLNTKFLHLANAKCFYETSIYNLIENSIYCGYKQLQNGKFIEIQNLANPPIISFATFKKANEVVKQKKENSGKQKYNLKNAERRHFLPFSGLLKCGNCGSKLTMGLDRGIVYYCKNTHLKHDKRCTPSRIRFDWEIDSEDFLLVFQPLFAIKIFADMMEHRQISNTNFEIEKLQADILNLKSKMKTIMEAFLTSAIEDEMFKSTIEKCKKEIVEKENKIISLSSFSEKESEKEIEKLNKLKFEIEDSERLIGHDDFSRLLRETIREVIVFEHYIKVILFDGNAFKLPRLKANRRSKKLPLASSSATFKNGFSFYTVQFDCDNPTKEEVLLETSDYKIVLRR